MCTTAHQVGMIFTTPPTLYNTLLNNSPLNMPIGLSTGWGIAYRYLLPAAIGG